MDPLLSARGLSKRFGALTALREVTLQIFPGEVVGLAGRNGAGKTVLTRILAGLLAPDHGVLSFDGRPVSWPFQAADLGISLIHQEPMLAGQFDITSNIFLGHELKRTILGRPTSLLDQRQMHAEARRILALLDVEFASLDAKVATLSSDHRQLISLAQGMVTNARLRIVDDPTALLSTPYQSRLLSLIGTWQQQGSAVLFSSQNLDHLFAVTDRIIVLRGGRVVANLATDETSREEVVGTLVGSGETQQYTPVIWALDSYYQAKRQAETLRHNQSLLEQDLAARDTINQKLLEQLSEQVQALDKANSALQDAQRRLLTQREMERKHLARELHDETIQDLLSLNYQLEEIASLANEEAPWVAELDDVRHTIRRLVTNIRGICRDLRPPTIDSLGLGPALTSFTSGWSERSGIEVTLIMAQQMGRLPEAIELSIFRIVQEGLNNVWKHAQATQVRVELGYKSARMLTVTIADDGRGLGADFDLAALSGSGHFGLLGISERVALLGGRLRIQNQARGGLRLIAEIPHPRAVPMDMH